MNRPYLGRINLILLVGVIASGWMSLTVSELAPPSLTPAIDAAFEGMVGQEATPTLYEARNHGGGSLLVRTYRHTSTESGGPLRLLLVGTGGDRHFHHPPEYAYLAQGWEVLEDGPAGWTLTFEGMPMRIVVASSDGDGRGGLALSWFTDGHRVVGGYKERVLWDVWDRIRGMPRPWVMVRLDAPVVLPDATVKGLTVNEAEGLLLRLASGVQRQLRQMLGS